MNSGIIAFLKAIMADIPENFETETQSECDDALALLSDEISHVELVKPPSNLNIEYSRRNPKDRISISDSGEDIKAFPDEMPIHRPSNLT